MLHKLLQTGYIGQPIRSGGASAVSHIGCMMKPVWLLLDRKAELHHATW
jgi:hypothetical protein